MALQPGIILGGQGVNALAAIQGGNAAAAQQRQFQRESDFNAMLQQNGAGIIGGDQGALNALAAYDPSAAMGVQQGQLSMQGHKQDMQFQAEEMAMKREQSKMEAQQWLAQNSANVTKEELAAQAQQLEGALSGGAFFYQNKDKAGYEGFLRSKGIDPAEFPFEEFPAHAAEFGGALDAMKSFAPPADSDRYKVVGGSLFDLSAEGGPSAIGQGAMQETMIMGPDGKPVMVQGGPGTTAKFTEAQSKDNVYATRAEGALAALDPVSDALTSRAETIAEGIPLGIGREFQSDEFQLAKQSGLEFLASILRKDTGAAVTPSEEEMYGRIFLPGPGDGEALLAQKREARIRAVEAIKSGMSPAQIAAMAQGLVNTETRMGGDTVAPTGEKKRMRYNPETGKLE